jgi:hypothetical protein
MQRRSLTGCASDALVIHEWPDVKVQGWQSLKFMAGGPCSSIDNLLRATYHSCPPYRCIIPASDHLQIVNLDRLLWAYSGKTNL